MEFTIKYNRTTNHIGGLSTRTNGTGEERGGAVTYYAQSACPSLTRSANFVAGQSFESLADALAEARKGARKLCKTCEKAALAQLEVMDAEKPTEDETNEGDQVTGKLKLSEVRGDIRVGSVTGSAGTIHAIKETDASGRNVPYCPTRSKTPLRSWGAAHEQKPTLELCIKCSKLVPTGPVEITEEKVEIPGLGKTVTRRVATPVTGTTEANKETEAVAATTMNKAAQDKAVEEINASLERLRSLITEGKEDAAKELQAEIKTAIELITGRGAAGIKASLRADAGKTMEDAKKAKKAADKGTKDGKGTKAADKAAKGKEVANLATTDLSKVQALPALYQLGFTRIVEAAKRRTAQGSDVAEVLIYIRSNILDKDGDPDLAVKQQITRDAASKLYNDLEKSLPEKGENSEADEVRDALEGIKNDARRATRTVTVEYVRKLDVEPDPKSETYEDDKKVLEAERGKYKNALEMFPADYMVEDRNQVGDLILDKDGNTTQRPIKWSERIFDYYEAKKKPIARTTRSEQNAQERRAKAARVKELEAAVKAGEISQEEADASLAEAPKENDPIKRLKSAFERQINEAKRLEDEDAKATRKDELIGLLAEIRKELNAL
ncbi:hypothetical protein [Streptomyces sp. NPDC059063]|uniref:hypothetical protein n=1 Tax=Streptomyces sp. NPDC059063 TaxID=3346712 RepID=UPI0036CAEA3D